MQADPQALSARFRELDEASLLRIAHASPEEYTQLAIGLAREELARRGFDYQLHHGTAAARSEARERQLARQAQGATRSERRKRQQAYWLYYAFTWLGALLLLRSSVGRLDGTEAFLARVSATFAPHLWVTNHHVDFAFGLPVFAVHAASGFWLIDRSPRRASCWLVTLMLLLAINIW